MRHHITAGVHSRRGGVEITMISIDLGAVGYTIQNDQHFVNSSFM
jgi:hypothetical protein